MLEFYWFLLIAILYIILYIIYIYIWSQIYHVVSLQFVGVLEFRLRRRNMTFSDTVIKKLGRNTWNDTQNITLLIRIPKLCLRHLADRRRLHGRRYKHTHIHTHIQAHTYTQKARETNIYSLWKRFLPLICHRPL